MFQQLFIFLAVLCISYSANTYFPPPNNYFPPQPQPNLGCIQPKFNANGTHSAFVGCVRTSDKLLFNKEYNKTGNFFSKREVTITYPMRGYVRNETITGIWMFDFDKHGTGGYGRVVSGGVGHHNVTIELRSFKRNQGFNYQVQIYGF